MDKNKVFPLPLEGRFVGTGCWKLTARFRYVNPPIVVNVPVDFVTDGASIPRFAYRLIGAPWGGKYSKAAVVHDYLYYNQTTTRVDADRIFYQAMGVLGVSGWRRSLMHFSVRSAGWIPWKNRRRDVKERASGKTT